MCGCCPPFPTSSGQDIIQCSSSNCNSVWVQIYVVCEWEKEEIMILSLCMDTHLHDRGWHLILFLYMQQSHLSDWLGRQLRVLGKLPHPVIALLVSAMVASVTEIMSNIATTTLFLPVLRDLVIVFLIILYIDTNKQIDNVLIHRSRMPYAYTISCTHVHRHTHDHMLTQTQDSSWIWWIWSILLGCMWYTLSILYTHEYCVNINLYENLMVCFYSRIFLDQSTFLPRLLTSVCTPYIWWSQLLCQHHMPLWSQWPHLPMLLLSPMDTWKFMTWWIKYSKRVGLKKQSV